MKHTALLFGWLCLCLTVSAAAVEVPQPKTPALTDAHKRETQAAAALPLTRWSGEQLRELARTLDALPESLAAEALCLAAAAPAAVDTNSLFAAALESSSPALRSLSASLLAGGTTSDSRRFLLNTLDSGKNPEIIRIIIRSLSNLPLAQAVRRLMDVMYLPGDPPAVIEAAAAELRRLTDADVGDNAGEWRDWWLDNEGSINFR